MASDRPRVLITGACEGVGRQCAETFAARGAELILADIDADGLSKLSEQLGATGRYCDVASEASVTIFAADILARFPSIDMVINAAGGGYERTLGMYRVSRAFLPALRKSAVHNIILNIPPADKDADQAIFPYASSHQAFQRLCAALAAETRGSSIGVLIGPPQRACFAGAARLQCRTIGGQARGRPTEWRQWRSRRPHRGAVRSRANERGSVRRPERRLSRRWTAATPATISEQTCRICQ